MNMLKRRLIRGLIVFSLLSIMLLKEPYVMSFFLLDYLK